MDFEKNVLKTIDKYSMLSSGDKVVIGLSGGADSVALALVLSRLASFLGITLHAAHVNHKIRGTEAERDSDFARETAEKLGMKIHLLECDIPKKAKIDGISEEMAGRYVRYDFFGRIAEEIGGGKIAVAHHMGDSAETVLINLIRGASLNGLGGIAPVKGNIIRPLIECERADIEKYLSDCGFSFVTDSTNAENIYTRNIIRNKIIPVMESINPNFINTLSENASLLREDNEFIELCCKSYEDKCISKEVNCVIADFSGLALHPAAKKRLIIRAIEILSGNRQNISSANIKSILALPTGGRTEFGGIYAQRSYEKYIFSLIPSYESKREFSYIINYPSTVKIAETGKTYRFDIISADSFSHYEKGAVYLDVGSARKIVMRNRKDGDLFSPLGLVGNKKVKDFLIDLKILPQGR